MEVVLLFFEQYKLMGGVGPSHLESNFERGSFVSPSVHCTEQHNVAGRVISKQSNESGHRKLLWEKIDGISYPRPNLCLHHWQSSGIL